MENATPPRTLRIGLLNLMPQLETYEPSLQRALGGVGRPLDLRGVRLHSHAYRSSDPGHLAAHYRTYAEVLDEAPLDGLVLTGAPVEHLPFEEVRYWPELRELLEHASSRGTALLGLCWGAMALARLCGIPKVSLSRKHFGAIRHAWTPEGRAWSGGGTREFLCPQSRHAALFEPAIEAAVNAQQLVRLDVPGPEGSSLLATPDARLLMHLGHPEYGPERLAAEWTRDRARGRQDVSPPIGYDLDSLQPKASWEEDSVAFFQAWGHTLRATSSCPWISPSSSPSSSPSWPGSSTPSPEAEG
jgi:homoserine O-succinyltransferase